MQDFNARIKGLIDGLEYQRKSLDLNLISYSEVDELDKVLNRIKDLYDVYLKSTGIQQRRAEIELLKYIRRPIITNIINKYKQALASIALIFMPFLLTSCSNAKDNHEEVVVQEESINEYYTITFKDVDGTVIAAEVVLKGRFASEGEVPIKDGYEFVGWCLNGEVFDFNREITKNLVLEAKWKAEKYSNKNKLLNRVQEISVNYDFDLMVGDRDYGCYVITQQIKDFLYVRDLLLENKDILGDIVVNIMIDRKDADLIVELPKDFIYSFNFTGDFSDISLKETLSGFKAVDISLLSTCNISGQDLERFLNIDGLPLTIFTGAFDKCDKLASLCEINNSSYISIFLEKNAPEVVTLPSYECCSIMKENEEPVKIITNSNDVRIFNRNIDNLNIEVKDGATVTVMSYQSFAGNYDIDSLFSMPVFSDISNASTLYVTFSDVVFIGQREDNQLVIRDTNNKIIGYIGEGGFREKEYYTRLLK